MISYLGSLVQFSPATGRVGRCRQISLCVGSTHRVSATLGFPRSRVSVLSPLHCSGSRCFTGSGPCIACGSSFWVLHKSADSVVPGFSAFPSLSGSGSQELDGRTLPGTACPLPSAAPASVSACWSLVGCQWLVFVLRSWPLAATLPAADVDHPESQGVFG